MKKMWIGIAIIAVLAYLVGDTLNVAGSFKSLSPHSEVVIKKVVIERVAA